MPFCRKCGRRLVEYSQSCPDCKTSTTAPIINTKRTQGSRLPRINDSAKITKAVIPQEAYIKTKVNGVKSVAPPKAAAFVQAETPKATVQAKIAPPIHIPSQAKPVASPKPVISAKHIIKPKRVPPSKPTARFTISFARPVASSKPAAKSIPAAPAGPNIQKSVAPVTPVAPPKIAPQPKPAVTAAKPTALPKPVTPAPVYPPHEIIKSKVSLKEDITANPQDYETQTSPFDLTCSNGHFWPEGKAVVVSNGKAFCLQCGERLRKPKPKRYQRRRYHSY